MPVLDNFLEKCQLRTNQKMKKDEKLKLVFTWFAKAQLEKIGERENSDKVDDDIDKEEVEAEEDDGEESEYDNGDDNDLAYDSFARN